MSNRPSLDAVLRDNQNTDKDHYVDFYGKRLLSKERDIVREVMDQTGPNVFRMSSLSWASDTAINAANQTYPNRATPGDIPKAVKDWNNTDGHRDAFRHAALAALTAREFSHHLGGTAEGVRWTGRLLHAHEGQANNNPVREAMDLHNNKVGLQVFRENPNASPEKLLELVKKAVDEGRTVVVNKEGKLAWSDQVPVYGHGNADHPVRKKAMGEDGTQLASADPGAAAPRTANAVDPRLGEVRPAVGPELRWNGDRTSLDYAFNIDQPRPSLGGRVAADLNALNSPQLTVAGRQVDNPYGDAMKKILEGVQSPEFTPQKNLDNAAALAAAWNGTFGEEMVAGHGKQGQLFLADGRGEAARMVSVNVKDTDGAAQKLFDAVVAKAVDPAQTQTPQTLAIEPEQRRQSAPSLG